MSKASSKKERVGEQFKTNEGYNITIVKYNNAHDLLVQFMDKHKAIVHTSYQCCKKGDVKNPYHPSVYGAGYLGQGKYKATIGRKMTEENRDWRSMIQRGFDEELKRKQPTYKDVTVNEECLCFQDFAEWWHNNYYEIDGETMCLDKDILVKGNKEYRFDRMIFVPNRINTLFTKRDNGRGNYPIGVSYCKANGKYMANCQTPDSQKFLGYYKTPEEAFQAYKTFKEQYIKQVADEYKDKIPQRLYDAMYVWEVEITD